MADKDRMDDIERLVQEADGKGAETISEKIMRESCKQYLDTLMYCFSPANQMGTYYRTGMIDGCVRQRGQLVLCLKLKAPRPDEERVAMYEELKRRNQYAPSHVVWPMREDPSKDWKTSTYMSGN